VIARLFCLRCFLCLRLSTGRILADLTNKIGEWRHQGDTVRSMMGQPKLLQVFFIDLAILNVFEKL
ncbi:MAG: hypothetical protein J0G97_16880, partial [Rhizobium pusense]|nr:hypothetical protein [Agrobacterium pusense]